MRLNPHECPQSLADQNPSGDLVIAETLASAVRQEARRQIAAELRVEVDFAVRRHQLQRTVKLATAKLNLSPSPADPDRSIDRLVDLVYSPTAADRKPLPETDLAMLIETSKQQLAALEGEYRSAIAEFSPSVARSPFATAVAEYLDGNMFEAHCMAGGAQVLIVWPRDFRINEYVRGFSYAALGHTEGVAEVWIESVTEICGEGRWPGPIPRSFFEGCARLAEQQRKEKAGDQ